MAYIGQDLEYGALEKQTLTGNGVLTTFELNYIPKSATGLLVSVGGVIQEPDVAYTISGKNIVFTTAPAAVDIFVVFLNTEYMVSSLESIDYMDYQTGTGTGNTTPLVLTHSISNAEDIFVMLNGINQTPDTDYTVSGTTLTFTSTVASGVEVMVLYLRLQRQNGVPLDGSVTNPKIVTMDAAKLTGSLPSSMSIDLTPEYQDISTLGLQWANVENKVAFNLTDDFMDVFQDDSGWVAYNGAVTTTPSSASDFTGSTSSFSYGSGSVTATTNNTAIYSTATLSGDFEVEATITGGESAAGWFGVFDSAEVGTFSSSQENGNMGSFTDTWFIATQSRDSKTEGLCGGSNSSLAAYTCNNNDVHKFKRVGSTLTVYQNGTLKYTETNIITGTMHVLFGAGGGGSSPFSSYESISWITDQQTTNTGSENVNRDTVGEYMSSIYTDTNVTTPSSSSDWAAPTGDPAGSIAGNTFSSGRLFYSNGGDEALRSATTVSGDFEFQVTVTEGQTAGAWVGVFDAGEIGTFTHHETGNMHSMNNSYYYAAISRAGQTAGFTARTSGSATNTAYSSANGDVVKITREGSTIKNYLNGTLKATATGVPTGAMYLVLGGGGGSASVESDYTSISWQTSSQYNNTSGKVVSTTSTADSTVSEATGVMVYKDGEGTNTIGTDLKAYFSADNGSNWTEAASYGNPTTFAGDSKVIPLGKTTLSNTGTQVKMKAEWANQVASSGTAKTITAVGDTQHSAAQNKIGASSIYFDGSGDYLSIPQSSDFNFGTGLWTVEFWYKSVDSNLNSLVCIGDWDCANGPVTIFQSSDGDLAVNYKIAGDAFLNNETSGTTAIDTGQWTHIAVSRTTPTTLKAFVNGVEDTSVGETISASASMENLGTYSGRTVFNIGRMFEGASAKTNYDANCYIDEIRVSNVARYTSAFTPSTTAFESDANTLLLIHSDGITTNSTTSSSSTWTGSTGSWTFSGDSVEPTAGDQAITSSNKLTGDFSLELTVTDPDRQFVWGVHDVAEDGSFAPTGSSHGGLQNMSKSWYYHPGHGDKIRYANSNVATHAPVDGSVVKITRTAGVFKFFDDNVLIHTWSQEFSGDCRVIFGAGGTFANILASGVSWDGDTSTTFIDSSPVEGQIAQLHGWSVNY